MRDFRSKSNLKTEFPNTFTYCIFLFRLKLMDKAILPVFKGSMLRGLMGKALHRLNCQSRVPCTRCKMVKTCAYSNLFKPELVLKNQLTTPPFVLYSPNKKEVFEKGDEIEFFLTLFGDFSRYFDYFLNAFNYARGIGLGQHRTPYDIEEITDNVSGDWVYKERDVNKNWKAANANLSTLIPQMSKHIKIDFLTPIFLMRNKKPIYFPTMKEIVSAIIRRIHILSRSIWKDKYFTIDKEFIKGLDISINGYDLNFKKDFKTGGLGNTVELSGFYGSVECCGDFTQLYPLLKAGEVLHIGARTSYGLGKYELTVL